MEMNELSEIEQSHVKAINLALNQIDREHIGCSMDDMKHLYLSTIENIISVRKLSKTISILARQMVLVRLFMATHELEFDVDQLERIYKEIATIGLLEYHTYESISLIRAQYFRECGQQDQVMNILHELEVSLPDNRPKYDPEAYREVIERIAYLKSGDK